MGNFVTRILGRAQFFMSLAATEKVASGAIHEALLNLAVWVEGLFAFLLFIVLLEGVALALTLFWVWTLAQRLNHLQSLIS